MFGLLLKYKCESLKKNTEKCWKTMQLGDDRPVFISPPAWGCGFDTPKRISCITWEDWGSSNQTWRMQQQRTKSGEHWVWRQPEEHGGACLVGEEGYVIISKNVTTTGVYRLKRAVLCRLGSSLSSSKEKRWFWKINATVVAYFKSLAIESSDFHMYYC